MCTATTAPFDPRCAGQANGLPAINRDLVVWLVSVVLTGLLIGLGGPFWYDMVRSLSQVLQLARSLGGRDAPATPQQSAAGTDSPAPGTAQPRNPVEAFRTATSATSAAPPAVSPRRVLGPLGT